MQKEQLTLCRFQKKTDPANPFGLEHRRTPGSQDPRSAANKNSTAGAAGERCHPRFAVGSSMDQRCDRSQTLRETSPTLLPVPQNL